VLGVWLPAPLPTSRAPQVGARFGRWREEVFGRARCLSLSYSLLLSVWVDPSAEHRVRVRVRVKVRVRDRVKVRRAAAELGT